MITLSTNENYDIFIGPGGNIATVTGIDAVRFMCESAMQVMRGEMIFNLDEGLPAFDTVFLRYSLAQFESNARRVLSAVPGVRDVQTLDIARVEDELQYEAVIETEYGVLTLEPTPWRTTGT